MKTVFPLQLCGLIALIGFLLQTSTLELPEGPARTRVAAFLKAYNAGQVSALRDFVLEHFSRSDADYVEDRTAYFQALYREFGPLSFRRHDAGIFWFRGDITQSWVGIEFYLDAVNDNKIRGTGVNRGIRPPGIEGSPPLSEKELIDYLPRYLGAAAEGGHFSGSVLVARNGRVIFEQAYGLGDRASSTPNTTQTRFRLASVTKMFIGTAIARLAQDGRLSFHDKLSRFVPEYPAHIADQVMIHHLLTHTSGIELDDDREFLRALADAGSATEHLAAQLKFIERLNLGNYADFKPLDRFDYTNEGIDLLGVVIERVSGLPWPALLQREIFTPAGMNATGMVADSDSVAGLAKAYSLRSSDLSRRVSGRRREVVPYEFLPGLQMKAPRPAGSGYSTTGDLFRFFAAINDGSLLSADSLVKVTTPQIQGFRIPGLQRSYGYAFEIDIAGGVRSLGHGGSGNGVSAQFRHYPDHGYLVIVLSNFDYAAMKVSDHIRELISEL